MTTPTYLSPAALAAAINKKFGPNTLVLAKDAIGLRKPRCSTGCLALDLVLGGGFPEGAIEVIEGEEKSGKSWCLVCRCREFLLKHPDEGVIIFVNAEGTNDPDFFEMLGLDCSRTYILSPNSGEEAWDAAIMVAKLAQKVYIAVDSLDMMTPMSEQEGGMADAQYAPAAKMNNKGFRKLITEMRTDMLTENQRVTVGIITQLRTDIHITYGDNQVSVGGQGKKFAAMQRIRYKQVKKLYSDEQGDKAIDRIFYGLRIQFTIQKNKGSGEGESGEFVIYKENYGGFRRGEIDNVGCLIPYLIRYKILKKTGAWLTFDNGHQTQGEDAAAVYLRDNREYQAEQIAKAVSMHAARYAVDPNAPPAEPLSLAAPKTLPRLNKTAPPVATKKGKKG